MSIPICPCQSICLMALLLATGCSSERSSRSAPAGVTISETPDGYLFTEGADSVMLYHARPVDPGRAHARPHYVHPLYGLDGTVLTEDFPEDHLHQHGLYWAWHQLYAGERRLGDGWTQEDVNWDVGNVQVLEDEGSSALRSVVAWSSRRYVNEDGAVVPVIEETATLRAFPAQDGYRRIDVTIELLALVDSVRLGGSEDEKGYGGLSLRVRLPDDVRFVGSDGPVEPEETAVEAGPWVDISAMYAGGMPSGVAILQHPSNPGYPQSWILRRKGSMQNPRWPGTEPVLLSTEEAVVLRYRLIVHRGGADAIPLDELQRRYAGAEG